MHRTQKGALAAYLGCMRAIVLFIAIWGALWLQAQDSSRVTILVEAVGSMSSFRSVGDAGGDLDHYYRTDPGGRAGLVVRYATGACTALRFGFGGGWRAFGSVTHEFRVPAFGTSMMVIARDQRTTISYVHLPLLFEWHALKPLRLLAGVQVLGEVGRTTRYDLGEPQTVEFNSGPVDLVAGAEFWPLRRFAVSLRYLYQASPVRVQERWTPDGIFQRTTGWSTMEAGVVVALGKP